MVGCNLERPIYPSIRGNLIPSGFIKFCRVSKGRYNIEKKIYALCDRGGLIPANFLGFLRNSIVYLRTGCNLAKSISALVSGET